MAQRALTGIASVALLALLAFSLFAWTRRVDERACARYGQQLRTGLTLDFRLSAEVMKARTGLVAHYDGIVQTLAARKRLHRELQRLPRGLWPKGAHAITARLREGEHIRLRSEALVERFKGENAVLRNSLRYLPVLSDELSAWAGKNSLPDLSGAIAALLRDALLLQSWQERALLVRIDRALDTLARVTVSPTDRVAQSLPTLVLHGRAVRERTPLVQELTEQITSVGDAAWTERMLVAFSQQHRRAQQTADFDAGVRFALAIVTLVAAALAIILAQRQSAAALRSTGAQLTEAVASLRVEQAKQQELSELKSRFVSMMSHEFRTPLSVIVSSSELLEAYGERWSSAKKQQHFVRIREAASGMTRMLDAILTLGRHNQGLLRFEPKALEIDRFCSELVKTVGAASGQSERVHYTQPAIAARVVADPILLRHVLENLLSNALKYSPDGAPVRLSVAQEEETLRFDVSDHGIGISADDQRHLFETFHRGKNVGEISGTGLGLAVVRGAVELHGGSVTVESELGVGTRFVVRIPCARSAA